MATETKTKVEAVVSAKVVAAIKTQLDAFIQAEGKVLATAMVIRSEAKRLAYDRDTARAMVTVSWRKAVNFSSQDEEEIETFDKSKRPDVSKVMLLAFPPDEKAAKDLEVLVSHNARHPGKNERVGINRIYEVLRGNQTAQDAIAKKPIIRDEKDAKGSKLPIAEQAGNAFAAVYSKYVQGTFTLDMCHAAHNAAFAAIKAEAKAPAKKAA